MRVVVTDRDTGHRRVVENFVSRKRAVELSAALAAAGSVYFKDERFVVRRFDVVIEEEENE
jgi:hypothetical protein